MSKEKFEYTPKVDLSNPITEWLVYGGVKFPRFLITRESFTLREEKYTNLLNQNVVKLAEGPAGGDAGDTHGLFHNELAWRHEQEIVGNANLAKDIGGKLHQSTVIENIQQIRKDLELQNVNYKKNITIASKVTIQYGDAKEDIEEIFLVPPLDGGVHKNWVSVESDLARSIERKLPGETTHFKIQNETVKIKVLKIE